MHRTQILLEDEQYERLKLRSRSTGRAIGDLVRQAVDQVYGSVDLPQRRQAFRDSAGILGVDAFAGLDGEAWADRHRRGLGAKLGDLPD